MTEAAYTFAVTFRDDAVGRWLLQDEYFEMFLSLKAERGNLIHGKIGNDLRQRLSKLGEIALSLEEEKKQKITLVEVFDVDNSDSIVSFVQQKFSPNEQLTVGSAVTTFLIWAVGFATKALNKKMKGNITDFLIVHKCHWQDEVHIKAWYDKETYSENNKKKFLSTEEVKALAVALRKEVAGCL